MKHIILKVLALGAVLTLVDCASRQTVKQVDAEVQAEPAHTQTNELANKGYAAVENSTSLTPEQKLKLTQLIDKAHAESRRLIEEDSKVKGVLIEAVTATPYDPAKVTELKHRLAKISEEKIHNTMHSLGEMQKIIGVAKTPGHDAVYHELLFEHPGGPRQLE